jgi:hypothetical protein
MSSGSSNVIRVATPFSSLSQGTTLSALRTSAANCAVRPFRDWPVSRAGAFRGAGAAFPTDGIVTKSNAS